MRIKRFNTTPSLLLGRVEKVLEEYSSEEGMKNGLCYIKVAGQVLALRLGARSLRYLNQGERYAIAYVSDGFADVITLIVKNPGVMKFFRLKEREHNGSLPTREVWKKKSKNR